MIRTHLLDASAIVKLLIVEADSAPLRNYFGRHSNFYAFGPCFIEAMSVLKGKHRRGCICEEQYHAACEELVAHVRNETLCLEGQIGADRAAYDAAEALAKKHSIDLIDAYQLVVVRDGVLAQLNGTDSEPIFVTADRKLSEAAQKERLRVWHCGTEPAP